MNIRNIIFTSDLWQGLVIQCSINSNHNLTFAKPILKSCLSSSITCNLQKQRVGSVRAIVCNANLIIADEPTGKLDAGAANKGLEQLYKLNQKK